jgi:hypothetical protein
VQKTEVGAKATQHTTRTGAKCIEKSYMGIDRRRYHHSRDSADPPGIIGTLITTEGQGWTLCRWLNIIERGSMNVDDEQHTGNGS